MNLTFDQWMKVAELAVYVVFTFGGYAYFKFTKDENRKAKVLGLAKFAYDIVEGIAKKTPMTADDKVAEALKYFIESAKRESFVPTDKDIEHVFDAFKAFAGSDHAKVQQAVKAENAIAFADPTEPQAKN